MPKRQNPFGDCSPLQFKNRISVKEVDHGVCAGEKMQAVYDKTKAMMFEGARRSSQHPAVTHLTGGTPEEAIVPLPGQLRLDSGGNLCAQTDQPMDMQVSEPLGMSKTVNGFFNNNNNCNYPLAQIKNGQLQINAHGQLTAGIKAKPCAFQGVGLLPTQCQSCSLFSDMLHGCSFCEKRACSGCVRTCYNCQGTFCHLCSLLNYDDNTERAFCLQCSP